MHLINTPSALAEAPALVANGNTQGYFTVGNPEEGLAPTIVDDTWLNAVQEEISAVIEGAPNAAPLSVVNNAQLLAAIKSMIGGPRRVQVTTAVSETYAQIPVKAWFTGALYQYAESCIDPSVNYTIGDQQILVWWRVGISNPTGAPIEFVTTIVGADDGVNVYWEGASIVSVYGSIDLAGAGVSSSVGTTIAAGGSGILDVLYYNRTTGSGNAGIALVSVGGPLPAGLCLYDPGDVFD